MSLNLNSMRHPVHQMKFPAAALIACLSACNATTGLEVSEQAALGQIGHVGPTLDQARRNFLGGGGGPLAGGFANILVDYSDGGSLAGTVALVRRDAMAGNLQVTSRLYAEHSTVMARLPDGLGVFTDPMKTAMWANGLGAEVAFGRSLTLPTGQQADLAAGLGLTHVQSKVHLQSALIDLRAVTRVTLPYLSLTARYAPVKGPDLRADIRAYSADQVEVRLGLVQSW
jgi:hypothetical protein